MRKISLFTLFVALLITLCAVASAADIPSSATGDYTGGGYACRIVAQAVPSAGQNGLEVRCTRPNSEQTIGLTVGNLACPQTEYLVPLTQWGGGDQVPGKVFAMQSLQWKDASGAVVTSYGFGITEKFPATWFRLASVSPGVSASALIGGFYELQAGGGTPVALQYRQFIAPTYPYPGCGAVSAQPFDVCRVISCSR